MRFLGYRIKKLFSSDTLNAAVIIRKNKLQNSSTDVKALLALAAVSIIWGTTWVVSKKGVEAMPALQLAGIRQIIAGMLYLGFFTYKKADWPQWKDMGPLFVLALLNFVMSNGLSTWGVKYVSAGLASIIGSVFPLWLVVIALFFSRTKTPRKAVTGLLLGFFGICIVFYEHLADFFVADFRFGITLSVIATWTWALGTLYTKSHAKVFNPYFGLGFQMLISGIILLSFSWFTSEWIPLASIPQPSWLAILYLVLMGSVAGFVSYLYALQKLPAAQASIYAYINPFIAVMAGVVFLGEKLSLYVILGGAVTLYGVYIVNAAYRNPDRHSG
jgi:drug/metabolite transporter (DMT)-like permease